MLKLGKLPPCIRQRVLPAPSWSMSMILVGGPHDEVIALRGARREVELGLSSHLALRGQGLGDQLH